MSQIYFFKKHDKTRFKCIDFTLLDMHFFLFTNQNQSPPYYSTKLFHTLRERSYISCDARMQVQCDADIELSKLRTEWNKVNPLKLRVWWCRNISIYLLWINATRLKRIIFWEGIKKQVLLHTVVILQFDEWLVATRHRSNYFCASMMHTYWTWHMWESNLSQRLVATILYVPREETILL